MPDMTQPVERFILHWGEMGTRWGINRSVAQIHALLYLSADPLDAEQIATTLSLARSNVSNSLKELQSWGIVRIVHVMGDRRDHFESLKDVWEMFFVILDERKKREADPTLSVLRELADLAAKSGNKDVYTRERLTEMLAFFETMTKCYHQMRKLPTGMLIKFAKAGDKLKKLMGMG